MESQGASGSSINLGVPALVVEVYLKHPRDRHQGFRNRPDNEAERTSTSELFDRSVVQLLGSSSSWGCRYDRIDNRENLATITTPKVIALFRFKFAENKKYIRHEARLMGFELS